MSYAVRMISALMLATTAVVFAPALGATADEVAASSWEYSQYLAPVLEYMPLVLGATALLIIGDTLTRYSRGHGI